jgi:hypothetical protein
VRQPEPEPGNFLNEEEMESNEEILQNKKRELAVEVSLMLSSKCRVLVFPGVFYAY